MTAPHHLSRTLLDAFFQGGASSADLLTETIRAIETECSTCRSALAAGRIDYARAVREARRRFRAALPELQAEHDRLPERLRDLATASLGNDLDTLLHVARDRRFHTTAFVAYQLATAWTALDAEASRAATQARDLADTAASRLETARYGRSLVAELRAEAELLRARLALAAPAAADPGGTPNGGEVEIALAAAADLARTGASTDLATGAEIGRACAALRAGDRFTARRHLEQAARTAPRPPDDRWHRSRETLLARLERRTGDPASAARRLAPVDTPGDPTRSARLPPARPASRTEWIAAREEVLAHLALGSRARAEQAIARRRSRLGPVVPRDIQAELDHLEGLTLPVADGPEMFRRAATKLRAAFATQLSLGHGLRAATIVLDLLRLTQSAHAGNGTPAGAALGLLDDLVARGSLPAPAITALATLARAPHAPTPTGHPDSIDQADDLLFALDPPWSPSPDGPLT